MACRAGCLLVLAASRFRETKKPETHALRWRIRWQAAFSRLARRLARAAHVRLRTGVFANSVLPNPASAPAAPNCCLAKAWGRGPGVSTQRRRVATRPLPHQSLSPSRRYLTERCGRRNGFAPTGSAANQFRDLGSCPCRLSSSRLRMVRRRVSSRRRHRATAGGTLRRSALGIIVF